MYIKIGYDVLALTENTSQIHFSGPKTTNLCRW